ncbi:unnamed protein product [Fraxinus pennsylvanica]|uniref:Uncharacterized protein n=1 Tax=Fraxinus pennsylvanica TaxID=56036 RepID=A0AAD1ZVG2_9LAMI|nr:unnamed protein product [Fraxinus pennsylvanica]
MASLRVFERCSAIFSDVIIGVIDSEIWLEIESFSEEDLGPPHYKWKVLIIRGNNLHQNCWSSVLSLYDHHDHTSFCSSWNIVKSVSFYELAKGNLRGGVPPARIIVYKVCHPNVGCNYGSGHMDPVRAVDPGPIKRRLHQNALQHGPKKLRLISGDGGHCTGKQTF